MWKKYLTLAMIFLVVPVVGVWAQTVTAGSGGTFATLTLAINSFRVGGVNASDPAPNVINCLDASYDEPLPLIDVQLTINGKAPRSTVLMQQSTEGDANDGLEISLPAATQLDLNNLILLPSVTTPPGDDLIDIQGLDGSICNFTNCIISANYAGAPASTDGITAPVGTATARCADNGINISKTATTGMTINLSGTIVVDAAGPEGGTPDNILLTAANPKTLNIIDGSIISYATRLNIQTNGGTLNVTGTHDVPILIIEAQNAGVTDADYGDGLGIWSTNVGSVNLTYCIIADNVSDGLNIHQGEKTVTMNHVIVANNGRYGINILDIDAVGYHSTVTAEDVTVSGNQGVSVVPSPTPPAPGFSADQVVLTANLLNPSSFTGCIVANGDNGFSIGATSTANAINSAIVLAGPDALTAKKTGTGTLNETNVITDDPQFIETTNFLSPSYFDVYNVVYSTAKGGSPLPGGADYAGVIITPTPTPLGFADVKGNWSVYW
jgi:hypothetical protein